MSNPVDDYFEEYGTQEKTALPTGLKDFGHQLQKGVTSGAGAAMATGLLAGVTLAGQKAYDAMTKARDFRRMMNPAINPDLHQLQQKDPAFFNASFSSLRNMNPAFSKDPIVAGTYVRQMMDAPQTAGGILANQVVPARQNFQNWVQDKMIEHGGQAAHKTIAEDFAERGRAHLEGFRSHLQDQAATKAHERSEEIEKKRLGHNIILEDYRAGKRKEEREEAAKPGRIAEMARTHLQKFRRP